jgi:hypothetical protein
VPAAAEATQMAAATELLRGLGEAPSSRLQSTSAGIGRNRCVLRLDGEVGDGEEAVIGITLNLLCSLV